MTLRCLNAWSPAQVVAERELTLKQLAQHDGSDVEKPLLLAIRGTVFDITPGAHPQPTKD